MAQGNVADCANKPPDLVAHGLLECASVVATLSPEDLGLPIGARHRHWPRGVAAAIGRGEHLAVMIASSAAFALAARPAANWLVDDAAITYAYGMNLGRYGQLVPNLEGMAVEGFSNPLNVAIVAILSAIRCFHPIATHRSMDAVVFGLIGLVVYRILRTAFAPTRLVPWIGVGLFVGLELCTPATMIWYGSGLENSLLTLGILTLLWRLQTVLARGFSPAVDASLLLGVALTRPEAPLFSIVWLVAAGLLVPSAEVVIAGRPLRLLRGLLATSLLTGVLLAAAEMIRYALFASFLPNTFYAKVTHVDIGRNYVEYVRPLLGNYWFAFAFSASIVGLRGSPHARRLAPGVVLFSCAALGLPLLAGGDWMGQHRFATAFLMLGHFSFAAACSAAWADPCRSPFVISVGRAIPAIAALLLVAGGREDYLTFLHIPYVSFATIADVEGFQRVRIQRYLGLIYPVVALPDAGGSTVVGSMQMVDTAYLTDYHMARIQSDPELVRRYQHEERRVDLAEYHAWTFDQGLVGIQVSGCGSVQRRAGLLRLPSGLRRPSRPRRGRGAWSGLRAPRHGWRTGSLPFRAHGALRRSEGPPPGGIAPIAPRALLGLELPRRSLSLGERRRIARCSRCRRSARPPLRPWWGATTGTVSWSSSRPRPASIPCRSGSAAMPSTARAKHFRA